jgi:hypothetical protein
MSKKKATENEDILVSLPAPSRWEGTNTRLLGLAAGVPIDPLVRIAGFSDKEFERFTLEWADGYLATRYNEIQARGGSGDKGRDIVAWIDPSSASTRRWDLYQCKHYAGALTPSNIWVELGKLCYYVDRGDYTMPRSYYLVSPQGAGNTLQDLIDDPAKLRAGLINAWDAHCLKKITTKQDVSLTGTLKTLVEAVDLSIVRVIQPHELISQHGKTKYHHRVFGVKLIERPASVPPPPGLATKETVYVRQIWNAFGDHLKKPIGATDDFNSDARLRTIFAQARIAFYSAESLKEFVRDSMPPETSFDSLQTEFRDGLLGCRLIIAGHLP